MKRGKKTEKICKNCLLPFLALDIKRREGGGKFCSRKCHQEFRIKNKTDERENNIFHQKKHKYGLTKEQYLALFSLQENKCAICKNEFTNERLRRANVDHCHSTNKVRGLLCTNCNTLLGMANDDMTVLDAAKQYLINS